LKSRRTAVVLAFAGAIAPLSGFHKFYLGQTAWGVAYLLLCFTPLPRLASAVEAVWYLVQSEEVFNHNFNGGLEVPETAALQEGSLWQNIRAVILPERHRSETNKSIDSVETLAAALRQLDSLRQEGLLSEGEFEQKRRQLLERL
jgi:TM2 domain-containing membrane protein YozV